MNFQEKDERGWKKKRMTKEKEKVKENREKNKECGDGVRMESHKKGGDLN